MWIHCNEMQWSDALKGVSMGLHDPAPFPLDWEFFGHSKSATLLEMGLHSIRLLENCQSKNGVVWGYMGLDMTPMRILYIVMEMSLRHVVRKTLSHCDPLVTVSIGLDTVQFHCLYRAYRP